MAERNPTKRLILFSGIFTIPAFLIYFFASGNQVFEKLLYYGSQTLVGGQSQPYKIPAFEFTDHLGNKVSNERLKGKVIILNTVVNSCPEECPLVLGQFYQFAYEKLAYSSEMEDVVIISHVVDHEGKKADPILVIEDLPKGAEIDFSRWMFVTGDYNPIYDVNVDIGKGRGPQNPYQSISEEVVGKRSSNGLMFLIDYDGCLLYTSPSPRD